MSNSRGTKGAFGKSKSAVVWRKSATREALRRERSNLALQIALCDSPNPRTVEQIERLVRMKDHD